MQIRKKLTYRFISIVAIILILSSIAIYWSSADYRRDGFYDRLMNRARSTAKLLIEVEEVDADLLHKMEVDNPLRLPGEKIIIYNYKNQLLYNTDPENELKISENLLNKVRLLPDLPDEEADIRFEQDGYEVIAFLFKDTYDRFVVIAAAKDIYGFGKLSNLRFILILVFIISIIVVSIAGWIYAGRALRPIARVVDQVNEISISSLHLRLNEGKGNDEIEQLSSTFNRMLARLEKAFNMQKNFIANASHELRTPLTVLSGQLEVSLMKSRTENEYRATIQSVLEDMQALNRTSNRLLLLAQASAESSRANFELLRIDDVLWQARAELQKRHPSYTVNIDFENVPDDDSQLSAWGNEQLLKTAVLNLMENGCKYSQDREAEVLIATSSSGIILYFRDRGIGIAEDELKLIFEPFHRAPNSIAYPGNGIGLSLVERIIKLHAGNITARSKLEEGSEFKLFLPNMLSEKLI